MNPRESLRPEDLKQPPAIVPRFGDSVFWYLNASREAGVYSGHAPGARPIVQNAQGYTFPLDCFEQVRCKDPSVRAGPVWQSLAGTPSIVRPTPEERSEFLRLLSRRIPPGPSYYELIEEIWYRGYEVFVVGGTVRDVISRQHTNDVDLVTTMPLERAAPLLKSMYRREPQVHGPNGYVRLGGTPASHDPFIDLKSFVLSNPGTEQAVFGGDFSADVRHRDFACNCVYYDPVNNVLIDPTGHGVVDAQTHILTVVCDTTRPPFHKGQIVVRSIKFRSRGFCCNAETIRLLRENFLSGLSAMPYSELIDYVERQVFGKLTPPERTRVLDGIQAVICEICGEEIWTTTFEPIIVVIVEEAKTK